MENGNDTPIAGGTSGGEEMVGCLRIGCFVLFGGIFGGGTLGLLIGETLYGTSFPGGLAQTMMVTVLTIAISLVVLPLVAIAFVRMLERRAYCHPLSRNAATPPNKSDTALPDKQE